MNKDKYVFAQLVESLDCFKFRRIVAKYQGDKYIKFFSCWNQLLVMMFGQLAKCESLRDLIVIKSGAKLYLFAQFAKKCAIIVLFETIYLRILS